MNIQLTHDEILYIDDCFSLFLHEVGLEDNYFGELDSTLKDLSGQAILGADKVLLLKLGKGLLESIENSDGNAVIDLEEKELWMIRELATMDVFIGDEPVGETIKHKVYKTLLEFEAPKLNSNRIKEINEIDEA